MYAVPGIQPAQSGNGYYCDEHFRSPASGFFEVVDLLSDSFLPSFIEGSDTLFVGQGSDIAYVDFGQLKGQAIHVSADRTAVTITLPRTQLEPAMLDVRQS